VRETYQISRNNTGFFFAVTQIVMRAVRDGLEGRVCLEGARALLERGRAVLEGLRVTRCRLVFHVPRASTLVDSYTARLKLKHASLRQGLHHIPMLLRWYRCLPVLWLLPSGQ
jgi:hypothetical protein